MRAEHLPLAVFPVLQAGSFLWAALFAPSAPAALAGALLCALMLSLSVHISFHELVHLSAGREGRALTWLLDMATLCLGIPFDGYRWHHITHHRFENGPEDFSTTREYPGRPLAYALRWMDQLKRGRDELCRQKDLGTAPAKIPARIARQKRVLLAAHVALLALSWKAWLLYGGVVYVGWALVALHNYGQHPPLEGSPGATSFHSAPYNFLFCNNGLHREHHESPLIPWHELRPVAGRAGLIRWPHLIHPLLGARS
jgi:fatty acid desaturase